MTKAWFNASSVLFEHIKEKVNCNICRNEYHVVILRLFPENCAIILKIIIVYNKAFILVKKE